MWPLGHGQIQTSFHAGGMASPRIRSRRSWSLIRAPSSSKYAKPRPARRRRYPGPLTSLLRSLTPREWASDVEDKPVPVRDPPSGGSAEVDEVGQPTDLEHVPGHPADRCVDHQPPALVTGDAGQPQHL